MPEDLPIYSESLLRSSQQFAGLDRLKGADATAVWQESDRVIAAMEGATDVALARGRIQTLSREAFLEMHGTLFRGREGAGRFRTEDLPPRYRGQDCAPPEFIERAVDNLFGWLVAESFQEMHPIEQCALAMTRVVDIWPFDFGNLTAAIVTGNTFLRAAGLTPFFAGPEHMAEFEKAMAQSMAIETQPLVNAIYATVKRGMETLAKS